jgi:hypothetical protein
VALKWNGTHQLLAYADKNLLVDNIKAIKINTGKLIQIIHLIRSPNGDLPAFTIVSSPPCSM